jgi:uncharacterized protein (TIRG00374 family)
MTKKRLFFLLKIIASAAAIAIIGFAIDLRVFIAAFLKADIGLLIASLLLAISLPAINALKIKLLLPGMPVGFGYLLLVNFTATFLRLTVPTDLGAELGRGYYIRKKTGSAAAAFSAIVLDRYFGLFSQCTVLAGTSLFFGLTCHDRFWVLTGSGSGAAAFFMLGMLAVFSLLPGFKRSSRKGLVRVTHALSRLFDHVRRFRTMPGRMTVIAAVSIGYHCVTLGMIIAISAAYHVSLRFHEAAALTLSSTIGFIVPFTVAGLGVIEGIYAGLFALFSLQKEIGVAVSLTTRAISMLLALPGVFFFIYGEGLVTSHKERKSRKRA